MRWLIKWLRLKLGLTKNGGPGVEFDGAHVVDGLHYQFLKQDMFDRMDLGIGKDDRRLYAGIIGAADNPDIFRSPFEEAYATLLRNDLGTLVDQVRNRDSAPTTAEALHELLCGEMRRLISYWEDPALEVRAFPLFCQSVAYYLELPPIPSE